MTDEEILKRAAEIEGVLCTTVGNRIWYHTKPDPAVIRSYWNPLPNDIADHWSDLGPLIEKYSQPWSPQPEGGIDGAGIYFMALDNGKWEIEGYRKESGEAYVVYHESLPHAILLAIIEAKK